MRALTTYLTVLLMVTNTAYLNAQRSCATKDMVQLQQNDPKHAQRLQAIENHALNYIQNQSEHKSAAAVVTIPIVFHVVYRTAAENISDAELMSQLQVLNDDFRRLNSDADGTWSQAVDTEIQFCLATVDPDGNATTGITRTPTSVNSFGTNDAVKFSSSGGKDAWSRDDYLNFWVCNIGGGILGYAQFPGGSAATDGVVNDYRYTGTIGSSSPFDLGRTATHEVGHWLNLRHIWGDGGCGVDDLVSDTPESDGSNFGCATGHVSCGTVDMVQNYMDYSDDACMNLFTAGQKTRMQALFAPGGARVSLLSSAACGELAAPTCDDNIQNGDETGVDCGGSCPNECPPEPTCGDGLQNGDEEGIDCGGSCSNLCPCDGNAIAITINLDNYPEETSWTITDDAGTTLESGGTYAGQADGSTVTESLCLSDGCYTFTINDTFGDGICCGYGNGSYSITDENGNTLASGGQFASSEATDFCFEDTPGCEVGTACDDSDDCTTGETYDANCNCNGGTLVDSDDDGVCDAEDACPGQDDDLAGTACDDGDPCTTGETYDAGCNCNGGTSADSDSDGICDAEDDCPNDPSNTCSLDYCDAQGTNTNYEFIQSVTLNGQTNSSGNDGGYGDYTSTTLAALSGTNTITLTPGFGSSPYAENWSIWIDFNKDGDFDDAGEQVYTGTSTGTTPLTGTFSTSSGTGTATMRVVMTWNATPVSCGSFTYGEVEDYKVELTAPCTPNTPCDDDDACTTGETYDANCNCTGGTLVDSDNDGVCDSDDACPGIDDDLIGTACDDGDNCTEGETYNANCNCTGGTLVDSDNDGVCDSDDACPGMDDDLIGTTCDDGDDCTAGETYDANCNCNGGTSFDADGDGVCDAEDICPGGDDNVDTDGDGIPDACDTGDGENPISPCINGFAGNYPCNDVDLMGFMSLNQMGCNEANDIWGWTDPQTGKEYAIFGCTDRTTFIDISSPNNPVLIGTLTTNTSASNWRDMKVYNDHAFIVSEASGHGMQVFDLTRLRTATPATNFNADAVLTSLGNGLSLSNSHNIVINEASGFVYTVGSNTCSGGLTVIDVNNPTSPVFSGCFSSDGYTHDAQCVDYIGPDAQYAGNEICFNSNENTLTIVDVSDKSDMSQISRTGYAGQRYTHQGWLTEDHEYFLMNDELDESQNGHNTRTHIWDVRDLDSPTYLGYYQAAVASIDHNLYIKGDLAYLANYRSGLRILDISDVSNANLEEIAYFDTYPTNDAAQFNAAWSNYPYFNSGNIIISDIEQGLFIVKHNPDGGGGCDDADNDGLCDANDPCPADPTNTCNGEAPDYCDAAANNSNYEYIQQVTFGNINNTSGNNGGYGDFTSQVANLGLGDAVPIGLTPGFPSSTYNEAWVVWIDFNRDGDFDDAGEAVYSGTSSGTLSGSATIPTTASTGLTGMRVAMQWNNPPPSCGSFTYGEVEDYTVNIQAAPQNYPLALPRNEDQLLSNPVMRIQPNPATDFINIGFQNIHENGTIQIYDLSGKPIREQTIASESDNLQVEISHLPAGMYIIRLQFGDRIYATERFVKLSK